MEWQEGNRIKVDPPKHPKKITGTRYGAVLGANPWKTPFAAWCEITRTYEKPFETSPEMEAGKIIEPKQAEYLRKAYAMTGLKTPTDLYGQDYFKRMRGDFFHEYEIFGGMWDYLVTDAHKNPTLVIECKTTKRAEDWRGTIPLYYRMQVELYAYLLDVQEAVMVATFLDEGDYAHPEDFVVSASNTDVRDIDLDYRHIQFEIGQAMDWWRKHVETGISPPYDEEKDAEILKALRTKDAPTTEEIAEIIKEAEELKSEIEKSNADLCKVTKRYDELQGKIKTYLQAQFGENDQRVILPGTACNWVLSKSTRTDVDKALMQRNGVWSTYAVTKPQYRLTTEKR